MFITLNPLTLANSSLGVMWIVISRERKVDYASLATNKALRKPSQQKLTMKEH